MFRMTKFKEMTKIIPEGKIGIARIEHKIPSDFAILNAKLHGQMLRKQPLACLFVNNVLVMSDGPEEQRSNSWIVSQCTGNVLIAGLGIGMILIPILKNKDVRNVTVIEKHQDVIDLIHPHIKSKKLQVICADIFDWKPKKGTKFDSIYFDIWTDICTDNLKEINQLHQKFKFYKAKNGWMESWNQGLLLYKKRMGG